MSTALVVLALQARLGDAASRAGSAARGSPERRRRRQRSARSSRPSTLVDLAVVDLQRVDQLVAQLRVHAGGDLEPHDLAEAAAAELVLDRLQQVVGLVGDVVVGVAGDPEERRGRRSPCRGRGRRGWRRSTSSSGTKVSPSSPIARKRPSSSFGTLTRATISVAALGVAEQHARGSATGSRCRGRAGRARSPAASAPGRPGS